MHELPETVPGILQAIVEGINMSVCTDRVCVLELGRPYPILCNRGISSLEKMGYTVLDEGSSLI
jgi:hypothetical protein